MVSWATGTLGGWLAGRLAVAGRARQRGFGSVAVAGRLWLGGCGLADAPGRLRMGDLGRVVCEWVAAAGRLWVVGWLWLVAWKWLVC